MRKCREKNLFKRSVDPRKGKKRKGSLRRKVRGRDPKEERRVSVFLTHRL